MDRIFNKVFGRIYLVNPKFQYRLMGQAVLIGGLSILVVFLANMYFFNYYFDKGLALNLPTTHAYFRLLKEQQNHMNLVFLCVASMFVLIFTFWGLFFSHRVAGPLFRLEKYFKSGSKHEDGMMMEVSFRKTDFFKTLAISINEYFDKQGKLIKEIKRADPPSTKPRYWFFKS
ncbi:MAG: hypothetical protein ISR65_13120 [Bacteriovoracaceae bacterium]|nr:hypothetical protein [Bacteriovoracaceae bacterium]